MVVSILIPKASVFSLLFSSCVFAVVSAAFAGKVTCGKNGTIKANVRKILKNRCFILSLPFLFDTFSPIFNFTKKRKKCQYICAKCQFFEKIYLCGEKEAKVSSQRGDKLISVALEQGSDTSAWSEYPNCRD